MIFEDILNKFATTSQSKSKDIFMFPIKQR